MTTTTPFDCIIDNSLLKRVGTVDATVTQLMALHGQPATAFDNQICFEWDCAALGLMIQAPECFKSTLKANQLDPNSIYTWNIFSDSAAAVTRLIQYYSFIRELDAWQEHQDLCPAAGLLVEFVYKVL